MIKTRTATVVYDPLDVAFDVVVSGSCTQTFEVSMQKYAPNLAITPLLFRPVLHLSDPNHVIVDGDYTADLVNVRYYMDEETEAKRITTSTGVTVYDDGRMLWGKNLTPDSSHQLICKASFIDPRRNEVISFERTIPLSCCSTDDSNLRMEIDRGNLVRFLAYDEPARLCIGAAVYNGKDDIFVATDDLKWEVVGEHHFADAGDTWFVERQNESVWIDCRYIDKLTLKAVYTHPKNGRRLEATVRIQRVYGQYEERPEIPRGSIITPETTEAVFRTVVTKFNGGDITRPERFFDITLAMKKNLPGARWQVVGYGPEKKVPVSDIKPKYGVDTVFGTQVRELSELRRCCIGKDAIEINGKEVYLRVPTIPSDFL